MVGHVGLSRRSKNDVKSRRLILVQMEVEEEVIEKCFCTKFRCQITGLEEVKVKVKVKVNLCLQALTVTGRLNTSNRSCVSLWFSNQMSDIEADDINHMLQHEQQPSAIMSVACKRLLKSVE